MKMFYVYTLNLSTEDVPFYIGKSYRGSSRLSSHYSTAITRNKTLRDRTIRKALKDQIAIIQTVVFEIDSEQEALDKECELIALYGRKDNGTGILCNHTDGGEGMSGYRHSPETIARFSATKRGKKLSKTDNMGKNRWQPISMYTLDDELVASFPSVKAAIEQTGASESSVHKHIVGKLSRVKIGDSHFKFRKD